MLDFPTPRFHLAMPVDGLSAARQLYGEVLGLEQGRSAGTWVDWNLTVTRSSRILHQVAVPDPQPGRTATMSPSPLRSDPGHPGVSQVRRPVTRLPVWNSSSSSMSDSTAKSGEQWTMFLLDPAGNALEFKGFADDSQVFAA